MTLCQLVVGEKAADNVRRQDRCLLNAIDYSRSYKLDHAGHRGRRRSGLGARCSTRINLQYAAAADPLEALAKGKIAVVSATPDNLKTLAANLPSACRPSRRRRLAGAARPDARGPGRLQPLVGFEHMIRPFRRERVTLAVPRNPLIGRRVAWPTWRCIRPSGSSRSRRATSSPRTPSAMLSIWKTSPRSARWNNDFYLNFVNGMTQEDGWQVHPQPPGHRRALHASP